MHHFIFTLGPEFETIQHNFEFAIFHWSGINQD